MNCLDIVLSIKDWKEDDIGYITRTIRSSTDWLRIDLENFIRTVEEMRNIYTVGEKESQK